MTRPPWRCSKHDVESVESNAHWANDRRGKKVVRVCPVCHAEAVAKIKLERGRRRKAMAV